MNNKLIKLLLFVSIGLCLIIVGEWLYASYMKYSLLTSVSSAKPQDYKTDELPEIELTKQPEESYVDLVARPLFIKGRRAVDEPRPEAEQGEARSENFDWQLNGIFGTKKAVSALFSRAKTKVAKDNFRKITVGDELDGWKLIEINKDRAVFKQGNKEKELLLRKPKSKELSRQPNQVAPPAQPVPAPEPAADTTEDNTKDTSESNP
jgi:type II secretory pathway component PulC